MKTNRNTSEYSSFVNASAARRNELAKQYEPMINKLVAQFHHQVRCDWDTLKSMAYEGLAIAINKYDPEKSKMSFTQYVAFSIRNNILTCLTSELRTVKMTSYGVQQAKQSGDTTFTSVSLSVITGESSEERGSREGHFGLFTRDYVYGQPLDILVQAIRDNFKDREQDMFFSYFGLANHEEMKAKELAEKYSVTIGFVSQQIKRVINFVKKDADLVELLASLMER